MTTGWPSLPLELRWMIVREIRLVLFRSPEWREGRQPFTALPLVSREFHSWFRHINFVFITLDQNRLDEFKSSVVDRKERRRYVQSTTLRVHLPENDNNSSETSEESAAAHTNKAVFLDTIHKFMDIMAAWKTKKKTLLTPGYLRMKLHLEVVSPSDTRFRQLRAISSAPARELGQHDTHPISEQISPADESPERQEGESLAQGVAKSSPRKFARAPVFDELTVSRSDPHYLSPKFVDKLISQGMPFLKTFSNKSWELPKIVGEQYARERFFEVSGVLRRNRVRSLGRFHDSSFSYHPDGVHPHGSPVTISTDTLLNYAMVATGLRFCDLSSLVDGGLFITNCSFGDIHYPELECLVLSSELLTGYSGLQQPGDTFRGVLSLAIFSLEYMPKLKVLDLSGGNPHNRLLTRYSPVTSDIRDQRVAVACYSIWFELNNLAELLTWVRQYCVRGSWQVTTWREDELEPAKDQPRGYVAGYRRLHYRMKRKYERINASVSTT